MNRCKKIIQKIRQGFLKEIFQEFRWIYGYGLHYKGSILWYIFLGISGTLLGLVSSVISKYMIDAVTGADTAAIVPAAAAYIGMKLLMIVFRSGTEQVSAGIEVRVEQEIRAEVYDCILKAQWESVQEYHSGDLLNRLNNDVKRISSSVIGWIPNFVTRLFQFAGAFGIILYYDRTLAGLALLGAPFTVLCSRTLASRIRTYNQSMQEISSKVMALESESLQNTQMIKSFGLTDLYGQKLRKEQEDYRSAVLKYRKFGVLTSACMSLVSTAVSLLCFCWGIYRLWRGHITYGTMTLFLQMASSLSGSFGALIYMVPQAISAATSAGRIMKIVQLPEEIYENEEEIEQLLSSGEKLSVRMERASFRYRTGQRVLEQVDFHADAGEVVALVGPSGEGKTTMLRILLGLVSVQEGRVLVSSEQSGQKIAVSASARKLFSYVPQENILFTGTIAENLRMIKADASEEEITEALKAACAYEFVSEKPQGIYSMVQEKGGGFSQGQIQRIAIARALLSDAPILLLDEATSALDAATEHMLLQNIMKYKKDCTCIVTTHRPSVLSSCDRVYQIADHQIRVMNPDEAKQCMMDY